MMIYPSKFIAMENALSDEVAVKVEGGYMLVNRAEVKRMKRK